MQTRETQLLRTVLRIDALTCFVTGAASVAFASSLAGLFGLSAPLLQGSGVVLLAVAAFILYATKNVPARRWPVWTVVVGNAAWVLASVLLLISGSERPTALGTAFVIVQAIAVAVLAELEYAGLRKLGAPTRAAVG